MTLDDLLARPVVDDAGQARGHVVEIALTDDEPPAIAELLTGSAGMLRRLGLHGPAWLRRRDTPRERIPWSAVIDVGARAIVVRRTG